MKQNSPRLPPPPRNKLRVIRICPIQNAGENLSRIRFFHSGNLLGRALRDDAPAALAAIWTEVRNEGLQQVPKFVCGQACLFDDRRQSSAFQVFAVVRNRYAQVCFPRMFENMMTS